MGKAGLLDFGVLGRLPEKSCLNEDIKGTQELVNI